MAGLLSPLAFLPCPAAESGSPWPRHTIDQSSRGADGVRMHDVNGDGLLDIATGWEEGGVVRVYLHPGISRVKERWPAVTVGTVQSVEDAVFVDLDGDGAMDVVSSCEGKVKSLFIHWAPPEKERYLEPKAWRTEAFPAAQEMMQWMFCLPLQVDGRRGIDLVAGGKNAGAHIGWWEAPTQSRRLADWRWHPLCKAGWIMSLVAEDMDGDGDQDILATDRRGKESGCFWLENPAPARASQETWQRHDLGGNGREVMFLQVADVDQDGLRDVLVATKPRDILYLRRLDATGCRWSSHVIRMPPSAGGAKGVSVGDLDLDGQPDLVFTCENASAGRSGVMWLSYDQSPFEADWEARTISGAAGVKFDLVELIDLDADGDLEVITCEEKENLGVFWYENPVRERRKEER